MSAGNAPRGKPASPAPDPSWVREAMAPEHPLPVYRVPADYFVGRIRRGEWFSYSKINHGFWEYEQILRTLPTGLDEQARREVDAAHGRRYCFETGFRDELIETIRTLPIDDPDLFFATSPIAYPGSDRIEGVTADPAALLSCIAETLPKGFVPHDGMLWKAATISGEIRALYDAIREHPVMVVGPEWLGRLQTTLDFARFEQVAIHPREARRVREEILAEIRARHARHGGRPLIVLFQAATLAPWLVARLHGELENACLIDLGRALDVCNPELIFRHSWGRVYRRALAENMGLRDPRVEDSRPCFAGLGAAPWQPARARANAAPPRPGRGVIPFRQARPARRSRIDAILAAAPPADEALATGLARYFGVPAGRRIVPCRDPAAGLRALQEHYAAKDGGPPRWCASAYADPRLVGPVLTPGVFLDCDSQGRIDPDALAALDPTRHDAVWVSNPYGLLETIEPYERLARASGKRMVIDGSAALDAPYRRSSRLDEVIDLGRDLPWGAGTAACLVVAEDDAAPIREQLRRAGALASLRSCARVLDRLHDFQDYGVRHHLQYARIVRFAKQLGYACLGPDKTLEKLATPASVPLILPRPVAASALGAHETFELRKRHDALAPGYPVARTLAERIVDVPCHPGLARLSNAELVRALEALPRLSPVTTGEANPGAARPLPGTVTP